MDSGGDTMTKQGDDQYGHDPKRSAGRLIRERLERQARP